MNLEKKDFFFFDSFAFLIILLIPFSLIVNGSGFIFETVTTKVYLFRILVVVASFLLLFSLFFSIWKNKAAGFATYFRHPILIGYVLFLLTMLASNLLSPRLELSFWSKYSRMDGYWQSIFVFQFLVILLAVFKSEKHWRYLVYSFLGVSWILFLILLAQQSGLLKTAEPQRFAGSMGNPIYLGYIMAVSYILHTAVMFDEPNKKWSWVLFLGSVACLYSVYWSQSRSGVLALFTSIILVISVAIFILKKQLKKNIFFLSAQLICAVILVYLAKFHFNLNISDRIWNYVSSDDSILTRWQLWHQAWHSFLQKPWLGWGQENFSLATDVLSGLTNEPWHDRVHNLALEILYSFGLLGLLVYVFFQFLILKTLRRLIRNKKDENKVLLLLALYVLNMTFSFFVFDFLTSSVVISVFLGYLIFTDSLSENKNFYFQIDYIKKVGLFFFFLVLCFQSYNLLKDISDNRQLYAALTEPQLFILDQNQQPKMLLQSLIDRNPNDLQTTIEVMMAVGSQAAIEQKDLNYRQLIYETVDVNLQRQIQKYPQDAKFYMYAGKFYQAFQKEKQAQEMLQQSLLLYPNNLEVKQLLSQIRNY